MPIKNFNGLGPKKVETELSFSYSKPAGQRMDVVFMFYFSTLNIFLTARGKNTNSGYGSCILGSKQWR